MTAAEALERVAAADDGRYGVLLETASLELGYYRPGDEDPQKPHDRDELYVIHRGHGRFVCDDDCVDFSVGDVLYVPAHAEHRFVEMSADFGAWVVFVGPRR